MGLFFYSIVLRGHPEMTASWAYIYIYSRNSITFEAVKNCRVRGSRFCRKSRFFLLKVFFVLLRHKNISSLDKSLLWSWRLDSLADKGNFFWRQGRMEVKPIVCHSLVIPEGLDGHPDSRWNTRAEHMGWLTNSLRWKAGTCGSTLFMVEECDI